MFSGKTLWEIILTGGFTMYVLLFCSVLSLTVIIERILYYRKRSRHNRAAFMNDIRKELVKDNIKAALAVCAQYDTPFCAVAHCGLNLHGHNEKVITTAMEREIIIETNKLERHTSIVGTIGSTAVYIGLFGTVIGIIRAFRDIAVAGSGGINVVIGGISEALVCTAAGLCVAVPAVIAYNYFIKRVDNFISDMELCASELLDLLKIK